MALLILLAATWVFATSAPAFDVATFPGTGPPDQDDASGVSENRVVETLARELLGDRPTPRALLHADRSLRTDVATDPGRSDLFRRALERMLRTRLRPAVPGIRIRVQDPVLHWMEETHRSNGPRLRGETLAVATLRTEFDNVAILVVHRNIDREWTPCGSDLCMHVRSDAVRRRARYRLAFPVRRTLLPVIPTRGTGLRERLTPSLSGQLFPAKDDSRLFGTVCDPLPSSVSYSLADPESPEVVVSHVVRETRDGTPNVILCGPFASSSDDFASIAYTVDDDLVRPPSTSTRAEYRNPYAFRLP